ncbi:LysR family transcriptional regulator [Serratia quinivorans]|uniref:LysR family transcriptional regulator n=1 Tax=Serratia quinivorans TaxID=137545 RepID=UPI00217C53CD|nr:LysR family transcriptional regulator [Serratia quinivorans]CAI1113681.1 HTH-type transcriptional regulator gltC [Serratia quinivorans]CAI1875514.1 HTH-type transcriptional regulator gltC [Serratia quinivorans]
MQRFLSRKIRNFLVMAKVNSISEAAKILHITPSPLGKSLYQLECELGFTLFDRYKNRLTLNENGKAFLYSLQPVIRNISSLENNLTHHERCNIVTLGIDKKHPPLISDMLISSISDKQVVIKGVDLDIEGFDAILNMDYDAVISTHPCDMMLLPDDIKSYKLPSINLGILAARNRIESFNEILHKCQFIASTNMGGDEQALNHYTLRLLKKFNLPLNLVYLPLDMLQISKLISCNNNYVTLIPESHHSTLNSNKYKVITPKTHPLAIDEYIYYNQNSVPSGTIINHILSSRYG